MGGQTSFPSLGYVHHRIVWYCFGSRKAARGRYLILGDDFVTNSKKAYIAYLKVLKVLGVSFTNNVSTVGFEFAKRIFIKGIEVTGAYHSALAANINQPELFALEWRNLSTRGYRQGMSIPNIHQFRSLLKCSKKMY
jgi:hypothetical protein